VGGVLVNHRQERWKKKSEIGKKRMRKRGSFEDLFLPTGEKKKTRHRARKTKKTDLRGKKGRERKKKKGGLVWEE